MSEFLALVNGVFGKITVHEVRHKIVQHAHSQIQFCYWLAGGEAHGVVNDEPVVYCEGMAVGINSYQAHDLVLNENAEPTILLSLYIDEKWFDDHFSNSGYPISFCKAQHIVTNEMKEMCWALMQRIIFLAEKNSQTFEQDVRLLIKFTIESNAEAINSNSISMRRKMLDYRLRLALSYLRDNAAHVDLLKNLSKLVGLSRSRLYALFKSELQSTPKLIWNSALLDAATNQISNSQDDFSVISTKFGFSTAANFSRFFRAHKGVTPTSYRKKTRMPSSTHQKQHEI
jgi:AraC-like DNA-binding protein